MVNSNPLELVVARLRGLFGRSGGHRAESLDNPDGAIWHTGGLKVVCHFLENIRTHNQSSASGDPKSPCRA